MTLPVIREDVVVQNPITHPPLKQTHISFPGCIPLLRPDHFNDVAPVSKPLVVTNALI